MRRLFSAHGLLKPIRLSLKDGPLPEYSVVCMSAEAERPAANAADKGALELHMDRVAAEVHDIVYIERGFLRYVSREISLRNIFLSCEMAFG